MACTVFSKLEPANPVRKKKKEIAMLINSALAEGKEGVYKKKTTLVLRRQPLKVGAGFLRH